MITSEYFTKFPELPDRPGQYLCLAQSTSGWRYILCTYHSKIQHFSGHTEDEEIMAWSALDTPHIVAQDLKW